MNTAIADQAATGDKFRCEKCGFEVAIIKACHCDPPCVEMKCCGKPLQKVEAAK